MLTILIPLLPREQSNYKHASPPPRRGAHLFRPTHHAACSGTVWRWPGPWWDVPLSAPTLPHAHLRTGPVHRSGRNAREAFIAQLAYLKLKPFVKNVNVSFTVSQMFRSWLFSGVRQGFFCRTEDEFDDWCMRIRRVRFCEHCSFVAPFTLLQRFLVRGMYTS